MRAFLLALLLSFSAFATEKEWTFVVYMNADNNLCQPFAHNDLAEMKSLDVSDKVNMVIVFDCYSVGDSKILYIKGETVQEIDMGLPKEFDMGDANFLATISDRIFTMFPAKHNFLTVWNHGSGWEKSLRSGITKGISYDDHSGKHISTPQLGEAIRFVASRHHLDILGFDACLMQMVEVSYEVAPYVDYTVGSEYSEPGDGWDYAAIVKSLDASADPVVLGSDIVSSFVDFYAKLPTEGPYKTDVQLSMINSQNLLLFVDKLAEKLPTMKVVLPSSLTTIYWANKDLGSFVRWTGDQELAKMYDDTIVANADNNAKTSGLAIFTTRSPNNDYNELKFEQKVGWLKYLQR